MMQFEKVFRKKVYQLTNINIKETPLTLSRWSNINITLNTHSTNTLFSYLLGQYFTEHFPV